ncbi:hypothetical protein ACOME3_007842 [Neoechinorhynchus agilis]
MDRGENSNMLINGYMHESERDRLQNLVHLPSPLRPVRIQPRQVRLCYPERGRHSSQYVRQSIVQTSLIRSMSDKLFHQYLGVPPQPKSVAKNLAHNQAEQRRRDKIKDAVLKIRHILPEEEGPESIEQTLKRAEIYLRFMALVFAQLKTLCGVQMHNFENQVLIESNTSQYENALNFTESLFSNLKPAIKFLHTWDEMLECKIDKKKRDANKDECNADAYFTQRKTKMK